MVFQKELLPTSFWEYSSSKRAKCLQKTPRRLLTGVVSGPSGICFGAIDPVDSTKFYTFCYKKSNPNAIKKERHLVKQAVILVDGRRMVRPRMRRVKNGALVWGEAETVHGIMSYARVATQLLAQNIDQVNDSNPVLRRNLERLSCSQDNLVGARDDSGIPLAQAFRNGEILRNLQPVMHIGPACAAGGFALDFPDGRYYNLETSFCDHKNFDRQTDALRQGGCEDPNEYKKLFVEYLDSGEEVFNSIFTEGYMAKYNPAGTASSETSASTSTSPTSGAPKMSSVLQTTTTPSSQPSLAHFFKSTPSPRSTPSSTSASTSASASTSTSTSTSASASASTSTSTSASTSASASTSTSTSALTSSVRRNKCKQSKDAFSRLGESLKKGKGKRTAEQYDSADDFVM
jgi:hypothetical protein